ncbi:hypothetical protein [Methylomonas sp. AM2-LC]|uniref:hypothetical protein n=1 Tax=Methylomonas sp. AM2-LC TaxID=3153301 RepID=UPI003264C42B
MLPNITNPQFTEAMQELYSSYMESMKNWAFSTHFTIVSIDGPHLFDLFQSFDSVPEAKAIANLRFARTAHNLFPEIKDRLDRLEKVESALQSLLSVINEDNEGDFFICKEASQLIIDANSALLTKEDLLNPSDYGV